MAEVSPSGPMSLPLTHLQTLLADCAALRTWVGAANAVEAKQSIFIGGKDPDVPNQEFTKTQLVSGRPFCVIDIDRMGSGFQVSRNASGEGFSFRQGGRLLVAFEQDLPDDYANNKRNAQISFLNVLGGIISEACDLAGSGDYLRVIGVELVMGPAESDEDEEGGQGRYQFALTRWEWSTF